MRLRKQALLIAVLGAFAVLTVPLYVSFGSLEVLTIGAGFAALAIGSSAVLALDYDWYPFLTAFGIGLATFPIAYAGYVAVGFIPLSIPLNGIYVPAIFGAVALSFPLGFAASQRQQALVILGIGAYLVPMQRILSQVGGTPLRQEPADFGLIAMAGIVLVGVLTIIFFPGYRLGRTIRAKQEAQLPSKSLPLSALASVLIGLLAWLFHLGVTYPITGLVNYWLIVGGVIVIAFLASFKFLDEHRSIS